MRFRSARARARRLGVAPTILLCCLALAFLFPLVVTVTNSFLSAGEAARAYSPDPVDRGGRSLRLRLVPDQASLAQIYDILVGSPQYLLQFWNSVVLTVPIVAGHVIVGAMAAYAFSILRFPGRDPLFFLYIVTMLMPYQVTLVPNFIVMDTLGLVGRYSSIILPGIFQTFGVFLLRQFMAFIPEEVVSAAKVDGARHRQIFLQVILPLSRTGLASLAILIFIDNWNMVEQPLVFLRDSAMHPLSVFLARVNSQQRGAAFAAGMVYMLPMILVFLYGERYLVQGIQLSGIRG